MPVVFVPYALRNLAEGKHQLNVEGATLGQVIDNLESMYPGFKSELVQDGRMKPGIAAVCGVVPTRRGLLQTVEKDTEIHFIPAISGGNG